MLDLHTLARYAVVAVFTLSVVIAFAAWLVRARRVSPFGALGRALRAASDPLIRPVEARLVRLGGNPVNAGWWLESGFFVEPRPIGSDPARRGPAGGERGAPGGVRSVSGPPPRRWTALRTPSSLASSPSVSACRARRWRSSPA